LADFYFYQRIKRFSLILTRHDIIDLRTQGLLTGSLSQKILNTLCTINKDLASDVCRQAFSSGYQLGLINNNNIDVAARRD